MKPFGKRKEKKCKMSTKRKKKRNFLKKYAND